MTDTFRSLSSELADALEAWLEDEFIRASDADRQLVARARTALAQPEPVSEQADSTLRSIRENTPRYKMSVIISTHDSAIDTRMPVIWSALDPNKEILESVSLPEQLPPLGNS